jgi:RND family efflux transporter MFP subunit
MKRHIALVAVGAWMVGATAVAETPSGNVEWARQIELGLPVSGVVEKVVAEEGQRVTKGALLMSLEQMPLDAEYRRAKARADSAGAESAEQERALKRAHELYDRGVTPTVELDQARLAASRARAHLDETRAAADLARYRLTRSRLVAPFDAYVVGRSVTPGQMIATELQPPVLFVLAESDQYLLRVNVPSSQAHPLHSGAALSVRVDDRIYAGEVLSVGAEQPSRDHAEGQRPVAVRFRAGNGQVLAGRRGELVIK